jgi:RNA polymerase-binding transcription factor DksA
MADSDDPRERLAAEEVRVEGLIDELRSELGRSAADDSEESADYDQLSPGATNDTFEREKDLSILEQLEAELAELQAALQRVESGTYGIDEVTGEPIDPERLEALPAARTNIDHTRDRRLDHGAQS